jgi:type IV secretory pathway TraG/TraD family ATPase VirD4
MYEAFSAIVFWLCVGGIGFWVSGWKGAAFVILSFILLFMLITGIDGQLYPKPKPKRTLCRSLRTSLFCIAALAFLTALLFRPDFLIPGFNHLLAVIWPVIITCFTFVISLLTSLLNALGFALKSVWDGFAAAYTHYVLPQGFWFILGYWGIVITAISVLFNALIKLLALFSPPPPQSVPYRPLPPCRKRNAGVYGNASFAGGQEVYDTGLIPDTPAQFTSGVYLGRYVSPYAQPDHGQVVHKWFGKDSNRLLAYTDESNILTIAPTRSGKGTAAIIPTLLTCKESMFVLDVKGENFFITVPARHAAGHQVILINPFNIWGKELGVPHLMTHHFNPLHHLHPDQPGFVSDIDSLAAAIIVAEGKDPHWTNRACQLVSCLMAYVCSDQDERAAGHNTLPYVRKILGFREEQLIDFMAAAMTSPIPLVADNAAAFTVKGSREIGSIISTAIGQLGFLNHPGISEFLSYSDFDFADLRRQPMTVYCMLPFRELDTYFRFSRLMVQSFFNAVATTPKPSDRRILALLDEQAKLRHMDILESAVGLLPGYKVRLWSIFQDLNQLKSIYGDAWETFIGNAGVVQIMTPNEATTANYFSQRVGQETITEIKTSRSSGSSTDSYKTSFNTSTSTNEHTFGVPFLSVQDLYAMPPNRALLFVRGMDYPILTTREPYYQQNPQNQTFYDRLYAPHPFSDPQAFNWLKNFMTPLAISPPSPLLSSQIQEPRNGSQGRRGT